MNARASKAITACLLACGLLVAGPALARGQEEGMAQEPEQEPAYEELPSDDETEFRFGYRGSVSVFGGETSGGTAIGTIQNLFFNTTLETGGDTAFGIRGTMPVWWRLAGEVEFLTASPGIDATLTDPAGQDRTGFDFAELDMTYVSGSVRLDLANAWINPFLQAGIAGVRFSSGDESETSLGVLFGGGVEVPVPRVEGVFGRVDVRGLRADLSGVGLPATVLEQNEDVLGTQVIWSVGLGYRF